MLHSQFLGWRSSWLTTAFLMDFFFSFLNRSKKTKGCCYLSSQCTHLLVCLSDSCRTSLVRANVSNYTDRGLTPMVAENLQNIPPEPPPSALTPAQGGRAAGWRFLQFYFHRLSLGTRLEFCHISCSWGCHYWLSCFHTFWHRNAGGCRSRGWPLLSCLQKRERERKDMNGGLFLLVYAHWFFIYLSSNNVPNQAY